MERSLSALDALINEAKGLPSSLPKMQKTGMSSAAVDASSITLSTGLITAMTRLFNHSLHNAFPTAASLGCDTVAITICANPQYGDLQCNSAMSLFKLLKGAEGVKKPQDVAAKLIERLPKNSLIGKAEVSGAGFINITLAPQTVLDTIINVARTGPTPPELSETKKKMKVLVDFSSPNIAKEMHVGHLRSTIIGDTICRVLEFCGCEVLRVNHVGDWGTQFGMLIQYLREKYPNWKKTPPNLTELTVFYKAAKKRFDEDEAFKAQARLNVPALQNGDPECRAIWAMLCDISRAEFQKVYDRLDVKLEEFGESYYNSMIPSAIEELRKLGKITEEKGAQLMFRDNWSCPLIVQKGDGGFGYDSTDIAAIRYRLQEVKADWIVYVTDAGQKSHFHMCFDAARDAGWVGNARLDHVGFGVVCGDDGKRFKTRSGETVRLVDLLDESVVRMAATLRERKEAGKTDLGEEQIKESAAAIGYGAVKYFDLHNHPATNYIFSYDRMLDTRGDTAVYLMFAYARLVSIIRKGEAEKGVDMEKIKREGKLQLGDPSERALAFELMQFPDVINNTLQTLQPNYLCDYLYKLSTKFTEFVTKCFVLGQPEQDSRLLLCEATRRTMALMFSVLGLKPLDRI